MGFFWDKKEVEDSPQDKPGGGQATAKDHREQVSDGDSTVVFHDAMRWRVRLGGCVLLLILSLLGMIITRAQPIYAWFYWAIVSIVYAGICLWLGWYMRREGGDVNYLYHRYWKEWVHWLAFLAMLYLTHLLYGTGMLNSEQSSVSILILLAFSTFLAGLYLESLLLLVGFVLGIFVVIIVLLEAHATLVSSMIFLVAIIVATVVARISQDR